MMSFCIGFILACVIVSTIFVLILRQKKHITDNMLAYVKQQNEKDLQLLTTQIKSDYTKRIICIENERDNALKLVESTEKDMAERLADKEKAYQKQLQFQEQHFNEITSRITAQLNIESNDILRKQQIELNKANSDNVEKLLNPLRQEMQNVRLLMAETRSANEKNTSSLEGALREMQKQTMQISQDATNLAEALKNRGKVHGDWGEQVLEDILLGSGLRLGIEYTCQQSFKGENGNELRPDVIVNCADGKHIIVDSKVSLTAYTDALGATTDEERQTLIKRNFESVKKHVKELADKQYPKYVANSMNYVLMFIPNEGAYVMAMNYDHSLAQDAFRQGVIIVNPTNLMMTLYLVLQTWQNTRQEDNCKKILYAADMLYEKVLSFVDNFNILGNQLNTLYGTYQKTSKQLTEGSGNILHRIETLKEMGVTSTRKLKSRNTTKDLNIE